MNDTLEGLKIDLIKLASKANKLGEPKMAQYLLIMATALEVRESDKFKKFVKDNEEVIQVMKQFGFLGG